MEKHTDTVQQIIEVAQQLIFDRGYNAFSYADIAQQVGIRKASIHYHFPAKSDLVKSVVAHYRSEICLLLNELDRSIQDPRQKLEQYIESTGKSMQQQPRLCLCALLAAEFPTLPEQVRTEVQGYFRDMESWFAQVIAAGREQGEFRVTGPLDAEARLFIASIQGAMLSARAYGDVDYFFTIARQLVADLRSA